MTESIRNALTGSRARFKAEDPEDFQRVIDAFLDERFGIIFGAIGGSMERVFASLEAPAAEAVGARLVTVLDDDMILNAIPACLFERAIGNLEEAYSARRGTVDLERMRAR